MITLITYIKSNYKKIKYYEFFILALLITYILNLYYIKKNIIIDINSLLNKLYLKNKKYFMIIIQLLLLVSFVSILFVYNYSYITAYCILIFLIITLNNNFQYIELFKNYEKMILDNLTSTIPKNKNSIYENFTLPDKNKTELLNILSEQLKYDKNNIVLDDEQLLNFINEFNENTENNKIKNQNISQSNIYFDNNTLSKLNEHNEKASEFNITN